MNEGLTRLLQSLEHAEFRRSFLNDPTGTLTREGIDGIGQHFTDVLADLTYEELRVLGNVGAELRVLVGEDGGGLLF